MHDTHCISSLSKEENWMEDGNGASRHDLDVLLQFEMTPWLQANKQPQ